MFWLNHEMIQLGGDFVRILAIAVLVSGIILWIVALLSRIPRATLSRSLLVAIVSTAIIGIIGFLFAGIAPYIGLIFPFILSHLLVLFTIQLTFDTTFLQALLLLVFYVLAQMAAGLLVGFLIFGNTRALL
jgi:hypothetical protein